MVKEKVLSWNTAKMSVCTAIAYADTVSAIVEHNGS